MRDVSRIAHLWPGLSRLWHQGDARGLGAAVAFTVLLNLVLWASFLCSDAAGSAWRGMGWASVLVFWSVGLWRSVRRRASGSGSAAPPGQQDLFVRAQAEYLKGHWVEAQTLLEQLIRQDPGDLESHLLLASVFRRTCRIELARRQIRQLNDLDGAAKWGLETRRELALLEGASAASARTAKQP